MSLENPEAAAEAIAAEDGGHRRVSMWFLVVPIVLAICAAALAFFLLAPRDDDLTATVDQDAVAVAVANARPAEPAFTPQAAETSPAGEEITDTAAVAN